MLQRVKQRYYKVKEGQTLQDIADAFFVSPWLLARENGLLCQPCAGEILRIPELTGDAYIVQGDESKELLCGSRERYQEINGTQVLYPGMKIRL